MKEFQITKNDAGQRLDRFLAKAVPLLPASLAAEIHPPQAHEGQRQTRRARHAPRRGRLCCNYTSTTSFLKHPAQENAYLTVAAPQLDIVYEDENILLVDKKPGQAVHTARRRGTTATRSSTNIQAYLYAQARMASDARRHSFTPALCNRIDRNTGGIVIAAKNAEALRILNDKIKRPRDRKTLSLRRPRHAEAGLAGRLENYLFKDADEKSGLRAA